jgi:hypothetical protein
VQADTLDPDASDRASTRASGKGSPFRKNVLALQGRGALRTLKNDGAGAQSIASDWETTCGGRGFFAAAARCGEGVEDGRDELI